MRSGRGRGIRRRSHVHRGNCGQVHPGIPRRFHIRRHVDRYTDCVHGGPVRFHPRLVGSRCRVRYNPNHDVQFHARISVLPAPVQQERGGAQSAAVLPGNPRRLRGNGRNRTVNCSATKREEQSARVDRGQGKSQGSHHNDGAERFSAHEQHQRHADEPSHDFKRRRWHHQQRVVRHHICRHHAGRRHRGYQRRGQIWTQETSPRLQSLHGVISQHPGHVFCGEKRGHKCPGVQLGSGCCCFPICDRFQGRTGHRAHCANG